MSAVQGSDEWLAERAGKATASNFDKVMMSKTTAGYQSYVTQLTLERIFGRPIETFKNKAMERGNELEPLARLRYALATKQQVVESPFVAHKTLLAGASPDGLVGKSGLVEFKVPLAHNHYYTLTTGKVPKQYEWQVVGQQWITGRTWTDFVSYSDEFPANAALAIIRVERDDDAIKFLEDKVTAFLADVEKAVEFITSYKGGEIEKLQRSSPSQRRAVPVPKTKDDVRVT
jgi:putative phage-type endonuclease